MTRLFNGVRDAISAPSHKFRRLFNIGDNGAIIERLRSQKLAVLRASARLSLVCPKPWRRPAQRNVFLVGCGRSGTTLLGSMLARYPGVTYLGEPYHLWWAVDPRSDVTNLHSHTAATYMMSQAHASKYARRRFRRLFVGRPGAPMLVEKTPHNVARVGYIDALCPDARFVCIVRDGGDVAASIGRLARGNFYRMSHRPKYNQWWGDRGCKWEALARDGSAAGYFGDEMPLLSSDEQKGAYEWLVSAKEAERWEGLLAHRWCQVKYSDLVRDPNQVLERVADFIGLDQEEKWLNGCAELIRAKSYAPIVLSLPPGMRECFNAFQKRFGFPSRAECRSVHGDSVPDPASDH